MKEKIKQEAAHAMKLIGLLNVNGDAVDVVAAARQSLRNIMMICDAAEEPTQGDTQDEHAEKPEGKKSRRTEGPAPLKAGEVK